MKRFSIFLVALGLVFGEILPVTAVFAENISQMDSSAVQNTKDESKTDSVEGINTSFNIAAQQQTIQSGQTALFNVDLKISGKNTRYHHAVITLQLPKVIDGTNIQFTQDLSELNINGVTPSYDNQTKILTYQFEELAPGISNRIMLKINTDNGGVLDGTVLNVSGQFTADEMETPLISATESSISANRNLALINQISKIESGNDNPIQGDKVTFTAGYSAAKATSGNLYLEPGSDITLTYQLDKYLSYLGLVGGGTEEPTVVGNTLTWHFTAPSIAEQKANSNFFNHNFEIETLVSTTTPNLSVLTNIASETFTFIDGKAVIGTQNAAVTISAGDPGTLPPNLKSPGYAFGHYGPIDGYGNIADEERDFAPDVYDNSILGFSNAITSMFDTSKYIPFNFYNVYYKIDPHLTLGNFRLGNFVFKPDVTYQDTPIPLEKKPVVALLVQYDGDPAWHLLTMQVDLDKVLNPTTLGADPSKHISQVWLWFHRSDITDYSDPLALRHDIDSPLGNVYMAPAGMFGVFLMNFSIEKGYVGKVDNSVDITFYGTGPDDYVRYVDGNTITWSRYPGWVPYFGPRSANVIPAPVGVHKVVQGSVQIDQTEGNMVTSGPNTVTTTAASTKASLVDLTGPFTNYILLPTGVDYIDDPSITGYAVSLASADYHGTGRQLVKVTWNQKVLLVAQKLVATFKIKINKNAVKNLEINLIGMTSDTDEIIAPEGTGNPVLTDTTIGEDTEDINNDGNLTESVFKSANSYILDQSQYLDVKSAVKGNRDRDFSEAGNVTAGQMLTYKLQFTNNSDDKITSLHLLDILPTVGDFNITDGQLRDSQYELNLVGAITLPKNWENKVEILYSTAVNPKRAGILDSDTKYPEGASPIVDPAGATDATWVTADQITDWSTIHSYKMELKEGVEWVQGKGLELIFEMKAPEDTEVARLMDLNKQNTHSLSTGKNENLVAFNSFGVATNHLQVVETGKVGVQLYRATQPVTVNYFDESGNSISSAVTLTGDYGEPYTVEQKAIKGYLFDRVEGATTGTYSNTAQTVNFYYKKEGAAVTVEYRDEDNKKLVANRVLSGAIGDKYTAEELTFSGYQLKETEGMASGTFSMKAQTVIYHYKKTVSPGEVPTNPTPKPETKPKAEASKDNLPQTGEKVFNSLWLSGLAVILIGGLVYWFKPKK